MLDNTSGDNKNKYVYSMLGYLVAVGMFKEVEIIHLMVGHTHNDVDAVFGVLAKRVLHATFYTLDDLMETLKASVKSSKSFHIPTYIVFLVNLYKACP